MWDATATAMASKGIEMVPFLLVGAILVEFLGGLALLVGSKTRFAALILAIFLIPVTFLFHNFWTVPVGEQFNTMLGDFLKNTAIIGGLLYIVACGPGRYSRDERKVKEVLEEPEEK
jgi:putative oxidoreductase